MLPGQYKDDLHSQYFPSNLLYKKTTQLYWFAMPGEKLHQPETLQQSLMLKTWHSREVFPD